MQSASTKLHQGPYKSPTDWLTLDTSWTKPAEPTSQWITTAKVPVAKARYSQRNYKIPSKTSQTKRGGYPFELETAIEESRKLLSLEKDWDGEGSPPVETETWERAIAFLRKHARFLVNCASHDVPIPEILPGPQGSIDIHWESNDLELLVNIPADPEKPAGFYGDDKVYRSVIKGSFDDRYINLGLIQWLIKEK